MSMEPVLVFGGDLLHAKDTLRCERLSGAAVALGMQAAEVNVLACAQAGHVDSVAQFSEAAVRGLMEGRASRPDTVHLFSANDPFSSHVARCLCVASGAPLLTTVVAAHGRDLIVVNAAAQKQPQRCLAGSILLVDERYFRRVPLEAVRLQAVPPTGTAATRFSDSEVAAGDVALGDAQLILAAGDGVNAWDALGHAARLLGATVGASKVVCDKGLQPRDRQVGSSGTGVAPRVYVALGISGSTQHLQGIADSARILAINTDPHAAIARRATLTLVADANAVLRALPAVLADKERQA